MRRLTLEGKIIIFNYNLSNFKNCFSFINIKSPYTNYRDKKEYKKNFLWPSKLKKNIYLML